LKIEGVQEGTGRRRFSLCREKENMYFGIHGNAKVVRNTSVCISAKTWRASIIQIDLDCCIEEESLFIAMIM